MILADKIITLRKKQGWSQEELAEKLEVSRQSVSKWEGGLSVPDLNKIIAMSTLFGVSTDFLLKDELEEITPSETAETDDAPPPSVSAEEANSYMDLVEKIAGRMAFAVMLCILSPVCLILLAGLPDEGFDLGITPNVAVSIGLLMLFVLVGCAVAIFVPNGLALSKYSYLDQEKISLSYGVNGIVEKRQEAYATRYRVLMTVGILLCIFSAVPLVILGAMESEAWILVACTALILAICSVGVSLMVRASYRVGSYQRLLQTGEFSPKNKKKIKKNEAAEAAYWSFVTALYLLISFLTFAWHWTWIVWPVAACLSPAFLYLVDQIKK
ncbi:MAG: helix-turn-helix transcriptional regulator [Clostridia bacterium]|nr:helix-turn-helix transcriptional regulator [Clostridia bacterium]